MAATQDKNQICTIRIAFPVETDEQAIAYKKKISEILSSIENARIEFTLLPPMSNSLFKKT